MVEVQFNWIFILIVGVIILFFFVGVSQWYRSGQETKIANDVLLDIETVLRYTGASKDTAQKLNMPNVKLVFSCDPEGCTDWGCTSSFEFEDTGVHKDTKMDIVFSQHEIETDQLNAWSLQWAVGYKIENFLYLSTPDIKFYLVYDEGSRAFAKTVFSKMGENKYVDIKLINGSKVPDQEYKDEHLVKYVMFYEPAPPKKLEVHPSMKEAGRWDVIFVDGDEDYGSVQFSMIDDDLRKPDPDTESTYLGLPALIGAIYSEDYENYRCHFIKALLRLRAVNEIYMERTDALDIIYDGDPTCGYFYEIDEFMKIHDALDELSKLKNFEVADANLIIGAINNIKDTNALADLSSCPSIY